MSRFAKIPLATAVLLLATAAFADDLTGSDRFLCSAGSVSACCDDGECASGTAAEINLPQFIEVDLVAKRIDTTKSSGLNRTSPIEIVRRVNGRIVLQGVENDHPYSFAINEKTGELAATITEAMCSVIAFAKCTPLQETRR